MNPILRNLADQIAAVPSAESSAVLLITGIAQRMAAAVSTALDGVADVRYLTPIILEIDALRTSAQSLSDAIAKNTPASAVFNKT